MAVEEQLIIRLGDKVIQTLLLQMPVLTIGRTPENGLSLPDQLVSRGHAELRRGSQGWLLTDLGSSNGTFLGNQRLAPNQPQLLSSGTTFRIGPYFLTYQMAAAVAASADEPEPAKLIPQPPQPLAEKPPAPSVSKRPAVPTPPAEPPTVKPANVVPEGKSVRPPPRERVPIVRPPAHSVAERLRKPQPRSALDGTLGLYRHFLPDIYQEDDFLRRFLMLFEDIWEPLEQRQDYIAMYFDPRTSPTTFLPWLARWLDLTLNEHWPEARKRRLLSQAMELYRWRGTCHGLIRMLEVCTGITPVITESPTQPFVFHIRVVFPPETQGERIDRALIEDLIQMHKPAHAGYTLEVL